jgi:transmembrane sensor
MTMSMNSQTSDTDRLEVASDWLLRIEAGSLDPEDLAQWLQWYDADPANRDAFEKIQSTFESIHALPMSERKVWASQLDDIPAGKRRFRFPIPRISQRLWAPVFATGLAFIAFLAIWQLRGPRTIETSAFKTERASHRDISLEDGSHVRLGAKSQLFVNFTSQTRYLVLEGGEAFFEVAKDSQRPFLVQAGDVTIRAVGTEFNVRRVMGQTIVAVTEGTVEVRKSLRPDAAQKTPAPIRIVAGEQASIRPREPAVSVKQVDSQAVNAWQEGRLEFADESLGIVIETINRYSRRDVVITDQAINDYRFTGTVSREHIDEWLFALSAIFPVDVRRVGNDTVLISPRAVPIHKDFRSAPLVR